MHPQVQQALINVPINQREKWHGYCVDVSCANQALEDATNKNCIASGSSRAVNIGSSGDGNGTPKGACHSCQAMLTNLGVNFE